jgi:hypothetical protein
LRRNASATDNALVKRITAVLIASLLAACLLWAKDFTMPRVERAETLPAHETHANEKVTIGIQPYTGPIEGDTFSAKYSEHDYVPILFAVTNDRGEAITLNGMKVELITSNRTKLLPASTEDVVRRFSRTKRRGDESTRTRLPIPLPRKGPDVGAPKGLEEEVQNAQFGAKAIESKATREGFLFFDIQGVRDALQGAKLYVTGVRDDGGNELMYFEISLDKGTPTQ